MPDNLADRISALADTQVSRDPSPRGAGASLAPAGDTPVPAQDQHNNSAEDEGGKEIDRTRYLRVVRYFAGVFAHFIFWEIILRRLLGQQFVVRSANRRWQRIARRYRRLAVELGGVLIKLGQFLSVRVDVLPAVVTAELSGLQDEVPPEDLSDIQAVVEAEYGQPVSKAFGWFSPHPEAAASLAQVHQARLLTGDEVIIKVQRPHIETIVETDLQSIYTATRWLKRYRPVRRRVNLDQLYEEFAQTTREELDFVAEGQNAERFARDFADDPGIRIPRIYAQTSTRRVLIMENVASIKIGDLAAIEAAGVSRQEVASRLFDAYLSQLFVHNFVHADPHPGNLFVQPLEVERPGSVFSSLGSWQAAQGGDGSRRPAGAAGMRPAAEAQPAPASGRPFRLVFVDFGMVATIPKRMRKHFREYLIGFATRDAGRMVRAYQGAGVLLPGADVARLEQMEAELLERYSGLTLRQARDMAMSEWQSLAHEYRDILYEMPFQIPSDLLFVGRAMAILFGMASNLDPDFDPWKAIEPFAQEMVGEEARRDWRGLLDELEKGARIVLSLPGQADRFFRQAAQGQLTMRTTWAPETTQTVRRVEAAVNRLAGAVIFAALLLAAVAVYVLEGMGVVGTVLFGLAALMLLITLTRH
jgi:predicted unusual protein kinase regulating ubiquinone biosynthesis (AarF/ABC1/UbiB family)